MGRKKKKQLKPWCWYCNREFDDERILIQHQKAKHFKCPFCHRKLFTGPGLSIHCNQVHKEKLDKIPNALPNRTSTVIDIYGMTGVPEVDLIEHERQKFGLEDEDEPPEKAAKIEDAAPIFLPPPVMPFLPAMAPPLPPFAPMGVIPSVPLPPPIGAVPPPPPPPPPNAPTPPAPSPAADKSPIVTPKATFPAYSAASPATKAPVPKVPKPVTGANGVPVELIHPSDDLSLEEIRAELEPYKRLLDATTAPPPPPPPNVIPTMTYAPVHPHMAHGMVAPIGMPGAAPMMFPPVNALGQPVFVCTPGTMVQPGFAMSAFPPTQPNAPPWPGMPPLRF